MDLRGDKMKIRTGRHNIPRGISHRHKYSTMYYLVIIPNGLLVMLIVLGISYYCYTSQITKGGTQQQMPKVKHESGTSGFV